MAERNESGGTAEAYQRQLAQALAEGQGQSELLQIVARKHGERLTEAFQRLTETGLRGVGEVLPDLVGPKSAADAAAYIQDASERAVLFLETMHKSGNAALAHEAEGLAPVLAFDYDIVVDGATLTRPVNYLLVRVRPPEGYPPQRNDQRPWVIIDPRAGQGSGIGGLKDESEVGVALREGHPVYFVIFRQHPEPGQTLADVCAAEAQFLMEIRKRHATAPKPLITGNCQGGWATMILAATHPELTGPLVIAGAPLSYWAGEVGKNPFRYLGGMMGGAVPALLASDLGAGTFDGANLVHNFEMLNPGRTYWRKHYDLYADEASADKYLEFDRWWSGFYFMTEAEIRWIVETLFVGNKLTRGAAILNDGTPVDLRNITAPIVVFASHGDNITPPQQALHWIADLYPTIEALRARSQVIIYTLHDTIGHLGIFVSGTVAEAQHREITSVVKTIESLAPGLYEMVIAEDPGGYRVSFEDRGIEDILAFGGDREEEVEFDAVSHLSDWAVKTYELTWRPVLRALITPEVAETLKSAHPKRQQIEAFSGRNPFLAGIGQRAEEVRGERTELRAKNPYRRLETVAADVIEQQMNLARDMRDAWMELSFHAMYGTPWMRAYKDLNPVREEPQEAGETEEIREVVGHAEEGGYPEAILRMLVLLSRARGRMDRDELERLNDMLHTRPPLGSMPREKRAELLHAQSVIVDFAGEEALLTLPMLLRDEVDRIRAVNLVLDLTGPADRMDAPTIAMFRRIQTILRTLARNWVDPDRPKGA